MKSNLPLAPSRLFRRIATPIINSNGGYAHQYTDPVKDKKRYCTYWLPVERDQKIIDQIEFALWSQGYTANTRFTARSLVGTCIKS